MPCLLGFIALFFPRLIIILVFVFSDYLGHAYQTVLWPVLGFIFLPVTTLAYAYAINSHGQVTGWYALLLALAILIDLGLLGSSRRRRR